MKLLLLASLALTVPASAQLPTVLLREGDPAPDGTAGQFVAEITSVATNGSAGYGCLARTSGPLGTVDMFFGTHTGAAPALLRAESLTAGLAQSSFDDRFGLTASAIAYSAEARDVASGIVGIDAAWLDDSPIAVERTPVRAAAGTGFWRTVEGVGTTRTGAIWFRGGHSDAPGGSVARRGLFIGAPPTAIAVTGDTLPGVPLPLGTSGVTRFARFSAQGSRWIGPAFLSSSAGSDGVMLLDTQGLTLGGGLVRESLLVPGSIGGIGEAWDDFSWCGINEAGDWFFCGETSGAPSTADDFICRNGSIWRREGDVVDGLQLQGAVRAASLNEFGELAYAWNVQGPMGGSLRAVFVEDSVVLLAGDAVDLDGDGVVDPGAIAADVREGGVAIGASGEVIVAGAVTVGGATIDVLLQVDGTVGTRYCTPNTNASSGPASIAALGSSVVSSNDLRLRCSGMPQNTFGFFLTSRQQGFVANPAGSAGNLCLGGTIGRFQMQVQNAGPGGTIEISVDLLALPQPNGTVAAHPGESWNFSTWFRDAAAQGGATSNFSDAISVRML